MIHWVWRLAFTALSNLDGWLHRKGHTGRIARAVCNHFEYCLDREANRG